MMLVSGFGIFIAFHGFSRTFSGSSLQCIDSSTARVKPDSVRSKLRLRNYKISQINEIAIVRAGQDTGYRAITPL
jgi:hypothetical protein